MQADEQAEGHTIGQRYNSNEANRMEYSILKRELGRLAG